MSPSLNRNSFQEDGDGRPTAPAHQDRSPALALPAAAALIVGVVLRLRGVFTDFWLGEIWGLRIALDAPSWLAPITRIHADTNHPLVSIYEHAIGAVRHWEWYRVVPFLCGVG